MGNSNSNLDIVSKTGRFSTTRRRKLSLLSSGVSDLPNGQIVLSFIEQGLMYTRGMISPGWTKGTLELSRTKRSSYLL